MSPTSHWQAHTHASMVASHPALLANSARFPLHENFMKLGRNDSRVDRPLGDLNARLAASRLVRLWRRRAGLTLEALHVSGSPVGFGHMSPSTKIPNVAYGLGRDPILTGKPGGEAVSRRMPTRQKDRDRCFVGYFADRFSLNAAAQLQRRRRPLRRCRLRERSKRSQPRAGVGRAVGKSCGCRRPAPGCSRPPGHPRPVRPRPVLPRRFVPPVVPRIDLSHLHDCTRALGVLKEKQQLVRI